MNIYVGNLDHDLTDAELRSKFEEFGKVDSVKIIKDFYSGQSKGFGFVEMASNDEGQAAISALNGQELKGRALKIDEARPRKDHNSRPRRSGGGGGGGGQYNKRH